MKVTKTAIIFTIITCIIIISFSYLVPACAEGNKEFYLKLAIVFEIQNTPKFQIVRCLDISQNIWEFYDNEFHWSPGDIVNLYMWQCNPETINDDEILDVTEII